jgi:hypothetical protein
MSAQLNSALASDLRFALDVMEENSHLGLDDEGASQLRNILLRHIKEAKFTLEHPSVAPESNDSWESQTSSYTRRLMLIRTAESQSGKRTRSKLSGRPLDR